jgi:hypothetical protein
VFISHELRTGKKACSSARHDWLSTRPSSPLASPLPDYSVESKSSDDLSNRNLGSDSASTRFRILVYSLSFAPPTLLGSPIVLVEARGQDDSPSPRFSFLLNFGIRLLG